MVAHNAISLSKIQWASMPMATHANVINHEQKSDCKQTWLEFNYDD